MLEMAKFFGLAIGVNRYSPTLMRIMDGTSNLGMKIFNESIGFIVRMMNTKSQAQ